MVPYQCPLRQARSSMPTSRGLPDDGGLARLTRRSSVSGLVGRAACPASLAPPGPSRWRDGGSRAAWSCGHAWPRTRRAAPRRCDEGSPVRGRGIGGPSCRDRPDGRRSAPRRDSGCSGCGLARSRGRRSGRMPWGQWSRSPGSRCRHRGRSGPGDCRRGRAGAATGAKQGLKGREGRESHGEEITYLRSWITKSAGEPLFRARHYPSL